MTREEAIKKLESLKISLPAAKDEISDIIKLIESPWISVEDDLPCNHEVLLHPVERYTSCVFAIIHGHIVLSRMYKLYGKWHWENNDPTHWFPIPKLP